MFYFCNGSRTGLARVISHGAYNRGNYMPAKTQVWPAIKERSWIPYAFLSLIILGVVWYFLSGEWHPMLAFAMISVVLGHIYWRYRYGTYVHIKGDEITSVEWNATIATLKIDELATIYSEPTYPNVPSLGNAMVVKDGSGSGFRIIEDTFGRSVLVDIAQALKGRRPDLVVPEIWNGSG